MMHGHGKAWLVVLWMLLGISVSVDISWVDYATFGLAVVLVVLPAGNWLHGRFFSHSIYFTNRALNRDVEYDKDTTITTGDNQLVYVKIRCRRSIEFGEFQVALCESSFRRRRAGWRLWKQYAPASTDALELANVTDWFLCGPENRGEKWPYQLTITRQGNGIVGNFSPVWPRRAGQVVALCLVIHARQEWNGLLGFYLPTATGVVRWEHLALTVVRGMDQP